jgi:hypothetical protein
MAGLPPIAAQVRSFKVVELQTCLSSMGLSKTGAPRPAAAARRCRSSPPRCTRRSLPRLRTPAAGNKAILQERLLAQLALPGVEADRRLWHADRAERVVRSVYCAAAGIPDPGTAARAAAAAPAPAPAPAPTLAPCAAAPPAPPPPDAAAAAAAAAASAAAAPGRVRCLCLSAAPRGALARCAECGASQHRACMALPEAGPLPAGYLCERCRAALADPFWEAVEPALLPPVRLRPEAGAPPLVDHYGAHPTQRADFGLVLADAQLGPARADPAAVRVALGCLLLTDVVPARWHWPRNLALRVNAVPYRPYVRHAAQRAGPSARDDAASLASLCVARGRNALSLTAQDSGAFVLLVQRARRRSVDEVKAMMAPPEALAAAATRVRAQLGGGGDVVLASQAVSLTDPLSGQRMRAPARFAGASGVQPFELDSLLALAARSRKWQDPTTLANATVRQLQADAYVARVLECCAAAPHVGAVEVDAEARWRPEGGACAWFEIEAPVAEVAAALAAAAAAALAADDGRRGGGGVGTVAEAVRLDEAETDEEEGARGARGAAAAAAAAAPPPPTRPPPPPAAPPAALAGQKRKEPEVIELLTSDDEATVAPTAARRAPPPAPAASPGALHRAPIFQPELARRASALAAAQAAHERAAAPARAQQARTLEERVAAMDRAAAAARAAAEHEAAVARAAAEHEAAAARARHVAERAAHRERSARALAEARGVHEAAMAQLRAQRELREQRAAAAAQRGGHLAADFLGGGGRAFAARPPPPPSGAAAAAFDSAWHAGAAAAAAAPRRVPAPAPPQPPRARSAAADEELAFLASNPELAAMVDDWTNPEAG